MIDNSFLLNTGIEVFLNTIPQENIPVLATVKINNSNYGRIDTLVNKYYQGNMAFLKFLMSFNKISDPIEIKLGMIFEIPDMNFLISQFEINNILEVNKIPGVINSMDNKKVNNISNNSTTTVAVPKLKIALKKVSYNSETGIITF